MVGNATIDAARKLRRIVVKAVAEAWDVPEDKVVLHGGEAIEIGGERRMITRDAFRIAEERFDTLGSTGAYNTPALGQGYRGGAIGASPAYSFTAHIAEVEVDAETGVIDIKHVWVAHDCGRAINPVLVHGQIQGSVYMGAGEIVLEEHAVDKRGLHIGPSLLDYRLPTTLDTPEIHSEIVESIDPEGPYGAKEAGEGPLHPVLPAVSNAIFDAVGIRLTELPFTAGKVLRALRAVRAKKEVAAE